MNIILGGLRRSGTHYLKDVLSNNFNYIQNITNIEDIKDCDLQTLKTLSKSDFNIFNTHTNFPDTLFNEKYPFLFENSKIILIQRDPKDIVTSAYFYKDVWKGHPFNSCCAYLFNIIKQFQVNWRTFLQNKPALILSFEELRTNYDNVIQKLIIFTNSNPSIIKNVTLEIGKTLDSSIHVSPNFFRKGVIGDYKNYMSNEWIQKYETLKWK